ncbi:MAG: hypothetical protein Q9M36_03825 [Sulfurovum sp.]|nr:hypothetical protein [Sulfurovum sp.]
MKALYKMFKGTRGIHREQSSTEVYNKAKSGNIDSQELIRDLDVVTMVQRKSGKFSYKDIGTKEWIKNLENKKYSKKLRLLGELGLTEEIFKDQLKDAWKSHV